MSRGDEGLGPAILVGALLLAAALAQDSGLMDDIRREQARRKCLKEEIVDDIIRKLKG